MLSACGSSKTEVTTEPSTTIGASTTVAGPTVSTATTELSTTPLPCQPLPIPTTPVKSPAAATAVLLTKVSDISDNCVDHVIFDFTGKGTDPPGYTLTYGTPPFVGDASGAHDRGPG